MSSTPSAPAAIPSSTSSVPIDLTPVQLEQYINRKGGIDRLSRIVLDRLSTTPDARTATVLASTRHMLAHAPPHADKPSLMKALSFVLKPIETSTRQDVSQIIPNSLHSAPDWLRHAFQDEYNKALCAYRAEQSRNASLSSPSNAPSPVPEATPPSRGSLSIFPIQPFVSDQSKRQKVLTPKQQSCTPLVPHPTCPSRQLAKPPIKPSRRQKPAASGKTQVLRGSVCCANTKPSNSSKSRPALALSSQTAPPVADEPMDDQPPQKDHSSRLLSHPTMGQKQEPAAPTQIADSNYTTTTTAPEANVKHSEPVSNTLPFRPDQPPPSADVLEAPLGTTVCPVQDSERLESLQSHASPPQPSALLRTRSDDPAAGHSSSKPSAKPVSILPPSVPVPSDLSRSVPSSLQQPNSKSRHPAVHKSPRPLATIGKRSSRKTSPKKSLPADPLLQGTNVFVDSAPEKPCLTSPDRFGIGSRNHSVTKGKEEHKFTSPASENEHQKSGFSKSVRESTGTKDGHAARSSPCSEMPDSSLPDVQHNVVKKQSGSESKNSRTLNSNASSRREVDTTSEIMLSSDAEKGYQVLVNVKKDAQVKPSKPGIACLYPKSAPPKTCNVRRTSRFGDLVREPATDDNREKINYGIEAGLSPTSGKTISANRGETEVEESRPCSGTGSREGNCPDAIGDKTIKRSLAALRNDVESEHSEELPKQSDCNQQDAGVDCADLLSMTLVTDTFSTPTVTGPLHAERKDNGQPAHPGGPIPCVGTDKVVLRHNVTSEIERLESEAMVETPANKVAGILERGGTTTKKVREQHVSDVQEGPAVQSLSTTGLHVHAEGVGVSLGEEKTENHVVAAPAQLANVGSGENDLKSLAETSKSGLPDRTERVEKDGLKFPSSVKPQPHSTKSSKADENFMDLKLNDGGMLTGSEREKTTCAGLNTNDSKNAKRAEKRVHQQTPPLKEEHVLPSVMESSSASSEPFKSGNRKRRRASIAKVPCREAGPSQTGGQEIEQSSSKKPRTGSEHLKAGESKKRKAGTGSLEMLSHAAANFAEVPSETGSQPHGASGGGDSAIEGGVVDSNSVDEEVVVKPEDFEYQQKILVALREVMEREHAVPFLQPVDLEGDFGTRYCSIVKQPMDLGTIEKRLSKSSEFRGFYRNVSQVFADLDLVWENCRKFNGMYDDVTLAANKCADDLGMLFVKLGVEVPKGHVSRRRTALLRRPTSNRSSQPVVKPESKPVSRKRKRAEEDEDLREIIAATTPCLGDNDGRLRNKEIAVFTTLEGRVKAWYRVRVDAYDTQTKSYSLTWIDEKMQTIGATFGLGMRYPVYRA